LAHWGPTVARIVPDGHGGRVDCGAVHLPRISEHYHVEPAAGLAICDGRPLPPFGRVRPRPAVYLPSRFHLHYTLKYDGKARCFGGTAAHLALVARGAAEAAIVAPGWSTWDAAAGLALIEVVGGVALRLPDGAPVHPVRDEGQPFVAGTPEVVAAFLRPGAIERRTPPTREDSP
jgi:fructose-1,6-bisphosphatase/inositol monophosphatase family enzyme